MTVDKIDGRVKKRIADTMDIEGECKHCGSENVEYMTRVTGFFSKVGSWNKGKIGELRDRRNAISANQASFSKAHA